MSYLHQPAVGKIYDATSVQIPQATSHADSCVTDLSIHPDLDLPGSARNKTQKELMKYGLALKG